MKERRGGGTHRWKNNIKMELKGTDLEVSHWI
jgi:hypothetical protein